MKVLHVEDFDPEKGSDYAKLLGIELEMYNVEYKNVDTLLEAKDVKLNEYDYLILDGFFPKSPYGEPVIESFFEMFKLIQKQFIDKKKIIVWSNSTRVHDFCFKIGLCYFSKKKYNIDDYVKKNVDPKVIASQADEHMISKIIRQ